LVEKLKEIKRVLNALNSSPIGHIDLQARWEILDLLREINQSAAKLEASYLFSRGHD
jgi:hypothetical protein